MSRDRRFPLRTALGPDVVTVTAAKARMIGTLLVEVLLCTVWEE